jgi:ribA/ribD-fused uncharacterized protein
MKGELLENEIRRNNLERQCRYQEMELKKAQSQLTWQEGMLKRTNLILTGVYESRDTQVGGCINSVHWVLDQKMGIPPDQVCIVGCYRMGIPPQKYKPGQSQPKGPRKIMVNLNTMADRQRIWGNKRNLKDSGIWVNEDLPREVEKRRAQMFPLLKKAKSIDKYRKCSYMVRDKLIVDQKGYTVETIHTLPADINPIQSATQSDGTTTYFYTKWSPFSNHFPAAPFRLANRNYSCTEQRYFARKAQFHGDEDRFHQIMAEKDAAKILDIGKKIEEAPGKNWENVEYNEMMNANRAKYEQNNGVMSALMATGTQNLAECSKWDSKWGLGIAIDNPDRSNGLGQNFMGKLLAELRDEFRAKQEQIKTQQQLADAQQGENETVDMAEALILIDQ